jgi:hypothetical protein
MSVLCVLYSKYKRQNPGQSGHRSTDKVQIENKKSRYGRNFSHSSRPILGPTIPTVKLVPGLFPGSRIAEAWHWFPIPN